jgi:hypothetical protein
MFGELNSFDATPTADGCKHRAEVAALLVDAGASLEGTIQVFDDREQPRGGAARPEGIVELAQKSRCDEWVKVVARAAGSP